MHECNGCHIRTRCEVREKYDVTFCPCHKCLLKMMCIDICETWKEFCQHTMMRGALISGTEESDALKGHIENKVKRQGLLRKFTHEVQNACAEYFK